MRNLTTTLCLTLAVLFGSAGVSWGQTISGLLSGLDSDTRLSIELACIGENTRGPAIYAKCIRGHLASIGVHR